MTSDSSAPSFSDVSITDVPSRQRFEARTPDGEVVGFAAYQRSGGLVTMTLTEVDAAHEGSGVGGKLARVALDQVRREGLAVDPQCPFIASWIERHEDYQDVLART
ncbi:MAG: N-acetyltransferase [Nocardioidaceae bacterium]|nr:N-acetyltransferase [Nocardioidaceae bacterium]